MLFRFRRAVAAKFGTSSSAERHRIIVAMQLVTANPGAVALLMSAGANEITLMFHRIAIVHCVVQCACKCSASSLCSPDIGKRRTLDMEINVLIYMHDTAAT